MSNNINTINHIPVLSFVISYVVLLIQKNIFFASYSLMQQALNSFNMIIVHL